MTAVLTPDEGRVLVALARAAIEDRLFGRGALETARATEKITAALAVPRGCFVTLEVSEGDGAPLLRGCIGCLEARLPTHEAAVTAALQASFEDPRFDPLTAGEYAKTALTVSVLTPPVTAESSDRIVAGRDGVILEAQGRRAVFLPEIATKLGWDSKTLLEQLSRKAGLPPDAWREAALWTFSTERFASGPRGEPAPGTR